MLDRIDRRGFLAALGSSVVATATGCLHGENRAEHEGWPMYGYDAGNTGYAPEVTGPKKLFHTWSEEGEQMNRETINRFGNGERGDNSDNREESSEYLPISSPSNPVVYEDVVYVGTVLGLGAYDSGSGDSLWRYDTEMVVEGTPLVADDTVYFGYEGSLLALDAETGERYWSFDKAGGEPSIYDGSIFLHGESGSYAVDSESGEEIWSSELGSLTGTPPAIWNGDVFVTGEGVYSLNAETGEENWSFESGRGEFSGQVAWDGLVLAVEESEGTLYALDASTGEPLWEFASSVTESPALTDDSVYAGGSEGFYCLDLDTGETVWSDETLDVVGKPAVADGGVYAVADEQLVAYDVETGDEIFSTGFGSNFRSPAVYSNRLYTGGGTSEILCFVENR